MVKKWNPSRTLSDPKKSKCTILVVGKRNHPAHPVVDVVAVEADKKNNNSRNRSPEDLKRQIAFHGNAISQLPWTTPEANQAEHK